MKKSVFAIVMMMIIGAVNMSANNNNQNPKKAHKNQGVVATVAHGNHAGNYNGNNGHGPGYNMGAMHNHNMGMNHMTAAEMKKCHHKDLQSMKFAWTKYQVKKHHYTMQHKFVKEVVHNHYTGHYVCLVCGYHAHR